MPAAFGESTAHVVPIGRGIGRNAAPVPGGVAVPAGGDDVGCAVTAAVAAGDEVFGGALEPIRLGGRQAVAAAERLGVAQPYGQAAVVAAPVLTVVGELACFLEGLVTGHGETPDVEGARMSFTNTLGTSRRRAGLANRSRHKDDDQGEV